MLTALGVLIIVVGVLGPLPPTVHEGKASQYAPGVMESVVRVRQAGRTSKPLPDPIPSYVEGFVAGRECDEVGQLVEIRKPGYPWRVMMIADCPADDGTLPWMIGGGLFFELDYPTAALWHTVGRACPIEWRPFTPEGVE